ncbi:MAG: acyl-CoA thioesterase [Longispora sp.]|nr:acyl-CoA thioesterase [Longispora sp. (in: high G+C Gram-positive bacteria)]
MNNRLTYVCPLRWSDVDSFGHVNNARFLTLFEEARVAMFFVDNPLPELQAGVVIARHEIDYLSPVGHEREVLIETWVEEIRNSSFILGYELFAKGKLASRARSVLVPFDVESQRPRRISDVEREYLSQWLAV